MRLTFAACAALSSNLLFAAATSLKLRQAFYTTNAVCRKKQCINPVFPGVLDLARLDNASWSCAKHNAVVQSAFFCRRALHYDPALSGSGDKTQRIRKQDRAASKAFFYHLEAMGYDAWRYRTPDASGDACVESIWRMVCYTYFPRAQAQCEDGQSVPYLRPCQNSCANYIEACGVECCDESVQCVFTHKETVDDEEVVSEGYSPQEGPSQLCTGSAQRSNVPSVVAVLFFSVAGASHGGAVFGALPQARSLFSTGILLTVALLLQGCDFDVPQHTVGNWRAEHNYLVRFQFVPPGKKITEAMLNSCDAVAADGTAVNESLQCSGHGRCEVWDTESTDTSSSLFCSCDRDWADPECRTRRKSQAIAYLLSLFTGFLGFDQFYLGFPERGVLKLLSLGGFGVWWAIDVVRIGSAPVSTREFRLAADLPHWVYVLATVSFAVLVGFYVARRSALNLNIKRRRDALLMKQTAEAEALGAYQAYKKTDPSAMTVGGETPLVTAAAVPASISFQGAPLSATVAAQNGLYSAA